MNHQDKKRVVIFDLGNVVLDWDVDRILDSLNLSQSEHSLLREELFLHQDWVDMDHGKKAESMVVSELCERSVLSCELVEMALLAAKNSLSPIPESLQLMQEIHNQGTRIFCLSNMSSETYDHIKNLDFFSLFSGIVISGDEGCMKPNEEIFQLALKRFDLQPTDVFFIDDSAPNIEMAQELGITGFHFKRSENCYSEIRKLLF
jgi:HAD superfamily hydrolase (TIGR01509 family)